MVVTGVGAYTYGGTTIGTNADGYQTTFWWDGTAWSNNGSVKVKGELDVNGLVNLGETKAINGDTAFKYIKNNTIAHPRTTHKLHHPATTQSQPHSTRIRS